MVVRGICCLVAGIPGDTENIEVISIVGRYLEHARIYIFGRGEDMKLYISSADFMTRNTIRRVEVAAPVYDEHVRRRIVHIFKAMISDNVKARVMQPDSTYKHRTPKAGEKAIDSQAYFISKAYRDLRKKQEAAPLKEKQVRKVRPRRIGGKSKSV